MVDHAVLIVGYDQMITESDAKIPYWTIRNSWGTTWGEGGYFRLQRDTGGLGMCELGYDVLTATLYHCLF